MKQFLISTLFFLGCTCLYSAGSTSCLDRNGFCSVDASVVPDIDMMAVIETCGPLVPISLEEVVSNTIKLRPQTGIQVENVYIQSGVVIQNRAPFDYFSELEFSKDILRDVFLLGIQTNENGEISRGFIQESKKFRLGTEVAVRLEADSENNPASFLMQRFSDAVVNFTVVQPILRGFVYGQDRVTEIASEYELEAVYYDSLHNISDLIRQSLIAYWNVVRSQKLVKVIKESVESFEDLAYKVQRLIDEDQMASFEVNQPLAQLAAEQINLKLAEQQLYSDVQSLKFTMGIVDIDCFSDILLYAVHPFPKFDEELDVCKLMACLTDFAKLHRLDKLASEIRIEELAVLVKGAKNLKLPRLDLFYNFVLTQFKRDEGSRYFFSSWDFFNPQRDNVVGVSVSYPFCNSEARGLLRRLKAEWWRQQLSTDDLTQQIVAETMSTWMNHIRLLQQLKRANEEVERFTILVTDENKRLDEGIGNLFNLVDYQARLTRAQERQIEINRNVAENLANLHFVTGSLILEGSNLCTIGIDDVTTLPKVECCP